MNNFTEDEIKFIKATRQAVLDKPADYVYPNALAGTTCTYLDGNGGPSCLVGHGVLNSDLVPVSKLLDGEGEAASAVLNYYTNIREHVRIAADDMQEHQDSGGTWREAYALFLQYLDGRGYDVSPYEINDSEVVNA